MVKLQELASLLYPDASPATIRQFPFAVGTPARPSNSALIELAIMTLLLATSGWFALILTRSARTHAKMTFDPSFMGDAKPDGLAPRALVPAQEMPVVTSSGVELDKAAKLAQSDPKITAAIIRKWLRQKEGHA